MVIAAYTLFFLCLLSAVVGSYFAEFRDTHVFNEKWQPHARFHCAAYGLTNMGLGIMSIVLLILSLFRDAEILVPIAIVLILIVDIVMLVTSFVPGVSNIAEGDKIYRNNPIGYWLTYVHLFLVVLGVAFYYL